MGLSPTSTSAPRSNPTSAAGNASVSRKARSAMYCAVHSPIPRILRSLAIASSIVPDGRKRFGSDPAAFASSFSVDRRAAGIPTSMDAA